MEEDKGAAATSSARVSASLTPSAAPPPQAPPSASSSNPSKESIASAKRQMFSVELKPGETTIVSWKKLLKEAGKGSANAPDSAGASAAVAPADALAVAPVQPSEGDLQEPQPSTRFSAVIEKIERLYMGKQSSDEEEELDDIPDDDQYDTEDSFIDDAELDEYFQVDKLSTKHSGYFVNRGKLERVEPTSSPNMAPKKRRRRDSTKVNTITNHELAISDPAGTGNVRIKTAARNAPLTGKKLPPPKIQTGYGEHYQEAKISTNKQSTVAGVYKKRSSDSVTNLENTSSGRLAKDIPSVSSETKIVDKHNTGLVASRDLVPKSRQLESVDGMHPGSKDRAVSSQAESQSRKSLSYDNEADVPTKVRRKEKYRADGFPNMDSSMVANPAQALQLSSTRVKDGSTIRPKGTTLERAIRDLEKIVALCRPPKLDAQVADSSSQGVKRRLPQEVKTKLRRVATLSACQNKISEDAIIDQLMGIVGHIVQRKTLKRNMREMVETTLSAKQEKRDRFQQIKQEVNEMIKARVSVLKSKVAEQHDGSADDFQDVNGSEERRVLRKYSMDNALEDKICELYDLHVEGMDVDKGPQSRKLYGELAELWPTGYVDSSGIKDAIFRSKERKRSRLYRHKVRDEERIKRRKLAAAALVKVEGSDMGGGAQLQHGQERLAPDSTMQLHAPPEKVNTVALSGRSLEPASLSNDAGHHSVPKHHDKIRSSSSGVLLDSSSKTVAEVKKKLKRKPEADLGEIHVRTTKLPSQQHTKEWPSALKHNDNPNMVHQPKQNFQFSGYSAASDQQS